ncbi:MAG: hypothetical protein NTV25_08615 [Methanothrix sp.]|nr:hypothetical protein [Methanothrix sp.]
MRSYKPHMMIIISLFFLSAVGHSADATLKDDAYHYMKNGVDDNLYNEWWYFNGVGNDSQFLVVYLLSDPDNLTSSRKLQALAVVLEDGRQPAIGLRQSRGFGGDRDSPTFDLDQSGFSIQEEPNLKVWGLVEDGISGAPIRWDLIYKPAVSPWFVMPVQSHVGHLKGDGMKWLAYMPSANVTGKLTLGDRTLEINATGYHDHGWGRWALNDPQITWAQVSVPKDGFSLTLGDILGDGRSTFLGIKYAGKTIQFSSKQIKLNYTAFAFDPATARTYPAGYKLEAENGDYRLELMIAAQRSVPLLVDYPLPMPSLLAFQQVSSLQGTLKSKSGEEYRFDETGFSGYTTHRLHPIFGRVNATQAFSDAANITVTATNERTGQEKTEKTASEGWFSIDADYSDYLANSTAPWVADGDRIRLEVSDGARRESSTIVSINMTEDSQEARLDPLLLHAARPVIK